LDDALTLLDTQIAFDADDFTLPAPLHFHERFDVNAITANRKFRKRSLSANAKASFRVVSHRYYRKLADGDEITRPPLADSLRKQIGQHLPAPCASSTFRAARPDRP